MHTPRAPMPSPERQKEKIEMDMCPGKTGSILCFSIRINKHRDSSICAVGDSTPGLPFQVAGPQGERLPVLEPEHLARRRRRVPAPTLGTVSPTALAHRSSHVVLAKASGRAPALVALPKGTLVERGRHPPGPCSRDLVSAKCFPVRLAEGSQGGMGAKHQRPCPRARWWSRGDTHQVLAQGTWCQLNGFPSELCREPF